MRYAVRFGCSQPVSERGEVLHCSVRLLSPGEWRVWRREVLPLRSPTMPVNALVGADAQANREDSVIPKRAHVATQRRFAISSCGCE